MVVQVVDSIAVPCEHSKSNLGMEQLWKSGSDSAAKQTVVRYYRILEQLAILCSIVQFNPSWIKNTNCLGLQWTARTTAQMHKQSYFLILVWCVTSFEKRVLDFVHQMVSSSEVTSKRGCCCIEILQSHDLFSNGPRINGYYHRTDASCALSSLFNPK